MKRETLPHVLLPALIIAGLGLSFLASQQKLLPGDMYVTFLLQQKTLLFLLPFMSMVSFFGSSVGFSLTHVIFTGYFFLRKQYVAATVLLITVLEPVVTTAVKLAIQRPRPTNTFAILYETHKDYGFPSGHTAHYTAFYGFMLYLALRTKTVPKAERMVLAAFCCVLLVFIGPSRIFLGAHWFSDVIGGYIIGALELLALIAFYHYLTRLEILTKVMRREQKHTNNSSAN